MSTASLRPTTHSLPLTPHNPSSYPPASSDLPRSPSTDSRCIATPLTPKPSSPVAPDKLEKSEKAVSPEPTNTHAVEPIIDIETFQQILDLDDEEDGDREFSIGMVEAYFEQASQTFKDMESALVDKDLAKLSSLGHFLKGSSAALGVTRVQHSCEKIQHYGVCRDEEADKDLGASEALDLIERLLSQVKEDYISAELWLKRWLEDGELDD